MPLFKNTFLHQWWDADRFTCAKGMSCPEDHALLHHTCPPVLRFFPRQIFPRREACISIALLNWDGEKRVFTPHVTDPDEEQSWHTEPSLK